ncbi:MAG: hypothetical protein JST35_02775 [Armatimonadetes bacterium]|nr:hypothetical protein [Armatimonadota bacterium]
MENRPYISFSDPTQEEFLRAYRIMEGSAFRNMYILFIFSLMDTAGHRATTFALGRGTNVHRVFVFGNDSLLEARVEAMAMRRAHNMDPKFYQASLMRLALLANPWGGEDTPIPLIPQPHSGLGLRSEEDDKVLAGILQSARVTSFLTPIFAFAGTEVPGSLVVGWARERQGPHLFSIHGVADQFQRHLLEEAGWRYSVEYLGFLTADKLSGIVP